MHDPLSIVFLLVATTAIAVFARRFAIPYPIAFVLGGTCLAFVPGLPGIHVQPDLVFVLLLPPLLFSGGWGTDPVEFRKHLRPIFLLSTSLVVITTCAVGFLGHFIAPELTIASAFVLGAVVSPPDAVAATNVFERFSVPRSIVTILEGEGLVNDATALVVYGFAIAAVTTGQFHPLQAGAAFIGVSVGGILFGWFAGYSVIQLIKAVHRFELSDPLIDSLFALLTPYSVYLLGGVLHISSVLATVVAGVYMSRRSSELWSPETRLVVSSVWQLMIFLINAFAFLLIGLELRSLVPEHGDIKRYLLVGALISCIVILVRLVWAAISAYVPRFFPHVQQRESSPAIQNVFVIGWSGMRGVVSLAAGLAIPLTTMSGQPFPGRSMILFATYCVIFATLVFQGLSLIPLLRWLKLESEDLSQRETEVRVAALEAGIARLKELESEFNSKEEWEVAGRLFFEYSYRIGYLSGQLRGDTEINEVAIDHRLQSEALMAEHRAVLALRDSGEIPDEIFRKIRYDLDLAETRLL